MDKQRTCIGCQSTSDKGSFMRIVRLKDGGVKFDPTGRASGRGAYVCSERCLHDALAKGSLARALRCKVTDEDRENIRMACEEAVHGRE